MTDLIPNTILSINFASPNDNRATEQLELAQLKMARWKSGLVTANEI